MTIEELREAYDAALRKLVEINEKNDWTPAGDKEFLKQQTEVWWAKEALIMASKLPSQAMR